MLNLCRHRFSSLARVSPTYLHVTRTHHRQDNPFFCDSFSTSPPLENLGTLRTLDVLRTRGGKSKRCPVVGRSRHAYIPGSSEGVHVMSFLFQGGAATSQTSVDDFLG